MKLDYLYSDGTMPAIGDKVRVEFNPGDLDECGLPGVVFDEEYKILSLDLLPSWQATTKFTNDAAAAIDCKNQYLVTIICS